MRWFMTENIRLKKEVEHLRACLQQESKKLNEYRALKNQEEWDEMRKKHGWDKEAKP